MRNSFTGHKYWVFTLSHLSTSGWRRTSVNIFKSTENLPWHRWSEMQRQLNLSQNGLRRSGHSTTIEKMSCSCLSQQDSQALQMTQTMMRDQLKLRYDSWDKHTVWADSLPIVPVQQQRSEDEQRKQGRLFKDKPELIRLTWLTNSPALS